MRLLIAPLTYTRAVLGMVFVAVLTIVLSGPTMLFGTLGKEKLTTLCMWGWSRLVLIFFGVRLDVQGAENLPTDGGAILAFNHQSNFDIPALTGAVLRTIRYGAKIELFSLPFFGPAVRAAGCLPIARNNRREVLKIYREASGRLNRGIFFALAPEGTRQEKPEIGTFKRGPFIFASSSDVPVVPVVIEGADRVLGKGHAFANVHALVSTIQIRFLPPLRALQKPAAIGDELPTEVVTDLTDRTRAAIVGCYEAIRVRP